MHKKDSPFPIANSHGRLECKELWGGIHNKDIEVSAGKVIGSIYSASSEGGQGGDIYYFGVCKGDTISRLAIADVTGHGEAVSEISQYVYDSLKAHMWAPDSRVILGEVNQLISSRSLDAMTTAAVVAYYSRESVARISYAGHPPILYRRAGDKGWSYARPSGRKDKSDGFPLNIPLAIELDTLYEQFTISMVPGDRLFVYTDGIIDTPSPEGESFGLTRLKAFLDANPQASLSELKSVVLKTLHEYTEKG